MGGRSLVHAVGVAIAVLMAPLVVQAAGKKPINQPPTVSITTPTSVSPPFDAWADIAIDATASDSDGTVKTVRFYGDSKLIGQVSKPPFTTVWKDVHPGTHVVTAVAIDDKEAESTPAHVSIIVKAPVPPHVTLTTNGTIFAAPAMITLQASVAGGDSRTRFVRFYQGQREIIRTDRQPPYAATWRNVPPGAYTLRAVAVDEKGFAGPSNSVEVHVTAGVTNTPPTISLDANGSAVTTCRTVLLRATASDVDGAVASVAFYQGTTLIGTNTERAYDEPWYQRSWNSASPGTYTFTAIATDNGGATGSSNAVTVTVTAPSGTAGPGTEPCVLGSNLAYQGSFRVPGGGTDPASFAYGGTSIGFNPFLLNGGSLFLVGHDAGQLVSQITIPQIRKGSSLSDLDTAMTLTGQDFTDATEGRMFTVNPPPPGQTANPVKIGGLFPYNNQLLITAYDYYDGDHTQSVSHFTSGLDLGITGDVAGPYRVTFCADQAQTDCVNSGYLDGYFGVVPAEWRAALGGPVLNGNCCLNVIGRTSFGPAAFTIDPTMLGSTDPLLANPLVYYWSQFPLLENPAVPGLIPYYGGDDGCHNTSTLFNCTSQVRAVVFPKGTRSVLFFGRQGLGPFCYGQGTPDQSLNGTAVDPRNPDAVYCYDPADASKGTHGWPYAHYVWAYDANDLAAVLASVQAGQWSPAPWDVTPYAVWSLNLPFDGPFGGNTDTENRQLGGATYDPATGLIYVSQMFGDGELPLIHVFKVQLP